MDIGMDHACRKARNRNRDMKKSVRHMGYGFLNRVETAKEEVVCLVEQMPT